MAFVTLEFDSYHAGTPNLVYMKENTSPTAWKTSSQRVSILERTNVKNMRILTLDNNGLRIIYGSHVVAVTIADLIRMAGSVDSSILYAPVFTTDLTGVTLHTTGATLTVVAVADGTVTYQWQKNTGSWADIGGATSASYATGGTLTVGWKYRCNASYGGLTTASAEVTVVT